MERGASLTGLMHLSMALTVNWDIKHQRKIRNVEFKLHCYYSILLNRFEKLEVFTIIEIYHYS